MLTGCPDNDCEGTIIALINSDSQIGECPLHNEKRLYCNSDRIKFYTIDYYVWWK